MTDAGIGRPLVPVTAGGKTFLAPPRTDPQRRRAARRMLKQSRRDVTDEALQWLAPVAALYRPGTARHRVALQLVRRGELPLPSRVTAVCKRRRKRAKYRARMALAVLPFADDPLVVEVLCSWIGNERRRLGDGPLWREVASAFGWPRAFTAALIEELGRRGVLAFSAEERSLTVAGR